MQPINVLFADFSNLQVVLILIIFTWSGFVRAGLGFGGAALSLPLLLLIDNSPLFFLPVIAIHLLIFSGITMLPKIKQVHWPFIQSSLKWIILPKLIGVIGLFSLPAQWMVLIIYGLTLFYAVQWLLRLTISSNSPWTDRLMLLLGGYFSGTSLTGAPLIISIAIKQVPTHAYRDTLFLLWFILVNIKLAAFMVAGVELQWQWALLLLAPASVGHVIGNYYHHQLMTQAPERVKQVLGGGLLVISIIGIAKTWGWF